jgi:hypothetical protein
MVQSMLGKKNNYDYASSKNKLEHEAAFKS